ncbi:MAG: sulfotransferase domain-containing protein [Alphaproteobacteria bacterium]|jgi:aryl sulfotransferase
MTATSIKWPVKQRDFHNHHFDSTIWDDFNFRDDDIVISTYAKSGTTWLQQIVAQLLFPGQEGMEVAEMLPWMDLRVPPKAVKLPEVEAQTHRRFVKTHLPADALVFSPSAKYLYIGRDGRDVFWSLYNHHANANDFWYGALNDTPGRVGPPIEKPVSDVRQYFLEWLAGDGFPFWPYWENIRTWWEIRHLPNVLFLHFQDMKTDMAAEIRRVAEFLEIPIDEAKFPQMLEFCGFDYMKANATKSVPLGGAFWDAGAQVFIHKGENGRWRDILTAEDCQAYESRAREELGPDCARWLIEGGGSE